MSVVYNTSVINDRLQVVITAIDAGAGSGLIQIGTAAMGSVLSTITLNKPSATISSGVMTFSGLPLVDGSAALGGNPAAARILDSDGTTIISGLTVSTGTADIIISHGTISAGDIVTFVSGSITGA